MELLVTVQLEGEDVIAGHLFQSVRHGAETTSFSYDASYLAHPSAFALAPDLPLVGGSFHSEGLTQFRAIEDCMPDRWGRNLMLRAERNEAARERRTARTLFETDMLTGVNDETRQGALRIWNTSREQALSQSDKGVPREVSIPALLSAADSMARDMNADVRDLLAAGSSLGGARPKASVRDEHGTLCIAKFPKTEEGSLEDVGAWERVCLEVMRLAGISVPPSRLLRVGGRAVLLLERFDREGSRRLPYISGISAVQGHDGGRYSYLELVEFLEEYGSSPESDIRELWARALFSCAVGNTDNHMRNHGFLYDGSGWRLSPAFDVNATAGDAPKTLATSVDLDDPSAEPGFALDMCEYFRLSRRKAKGRAHEMALALKGWRKLAVANGISAASIEMMASCFEAGIAKLGEL